MAITKVIIVGINSAKFKEIDPVAFAALFSLKIREGTVPSHWRRLMTIFLNEIMFVGRCVYDGGASLPSPNKYAKIIVFRRTRKKKKK